MPTLTTDGATPVEEVGEDMEVAVVDTEDAEEDGEVVEAMAEVAIPLTAAAATEAIHSVDVEEDGVDSEAVEDTATMEATTAAAMVTLVDPTPSRAESVAAAGELG